MKVLSRNCITVYYSLVLSETDTYDEYGNLTGSPQLTYSEPTPAKMAWGPRAGAGNISSTAHGLEENYVDDLTTDDTDCPMTVGTIVWLHTAPVDEQGNPVPHTHVVMDVTPSFNSIRYRVRQVSAGVT